MRRLNRVTGLILSTLVSLVLACGGGSNSPIDAGPGQDSSTVDGGTVCLPDETLCGVDCVDTDTDEAHCGACGAPCSPVGECVAAQCAEPLAAMQTEDVGVAPGDLFVVRDMTLTRTQLNTAAFATGRVIDHAVLPDRSLVMVAAEGTESTFELFHVRADGTALTRVSPALPAGRAILPGIAVSRDGSTVLYRANQDNANVVELYAVKLANPGVSARVNGTLVAGGTVSRVFALSSNGDRAAYVADQDTAGLDEAYIVALSGTPGASTKLNPATAESIYDLAISGDGATVAYRQPVNGGDPQLFIVATATPGTATRVPVDPNSTDGHVVSYQFAPAGDAVFFVGSVFYLDEGLWRVPVAAPAAPVELVPAGTQTDQVREDFVISSDGATVFYRKATSLFDRLYSVSVQSPATPALLSDPGTDADDEVTDFTLSPDETSVVFRAGADGAEGPQTTPGTQEPLATRDFAPSLQYLDLTNSSASIQQASTPLNGENGIAPGYLAIRGGGRALYRADHDAAGRLDAYLTTISTVVRVSPEQGSVATAVTALSGF
jgi:hypothetical protein